MSLMARAYARHVGRSSIVVGPVCIVVLTGVCSSEGCHIIRGPRSDRSMLLAGESAQSQEPGESGDR